MPIVRKLEPIDLFNELVRHPKVRRISAGEFKFEKAIDFSITISRRAADELAMESMAYKEFYKSANTLARLVDMKAAGQFVDEKSMQLAKDMYISARDLCRKISIVIARQDTVREYNE